MSELDLIKIEGRAEKYTNNMVIISVEDWSMILGEIKRMQNEILDLKSEIEGLENALRPDQ